jgi:predicted nucleotide-binding protein
MRPRAWQNVWLEVGWFWGCLGRKRVLVMCKGNIEIPSDLQGLEYYRYSDTPTEAGDSIRDFVRQLRG